MGKVSAGPAYKNKKGDYRTQVQMDYKLALRIATGDIEALDDIKRALTSHVEGVERRAQEANDSE